MRWMIGLAIAAIVVSGAAAWAAHLIVTGGAAQSFSVAGAGFPSATDTATPVNTATRTPGTRTPTVTRTPTRTPTRTRTATPTATGTSSPCPARPRAELEFNPDEIEREGDGPFNTTIRLENEGSSDARDVLLGLRVDEGAGFIDRVEFGNGQVWQIYGGGTSTLYLVGTIAGHSAVSIPITIWMRPGWLTAHGEPEAEIHVEVASARCLKESTRSHLTIELERDEDDDEHEGDHHAILAGTPDAGNVANPSATPELLTPTPVDTATSTPTDTALPVTDTQTPAPFSAETPVAD